MLSKKSCYKRAPFRAALFWDDLRRYSPIWVCASLILLLLPFTLWLTFQNQLQAELMRSNGVLETYVYSYSNLSAARATEAAQTIAVNLNRVLLEALCAAAPIAAMLYAVIPAMALVHYLYQSRSALGVHALPITRTELFVTHYLAGVAMMVLPLLIFCVASVPILLIAGAFWPKVLLTFCAGVLGLYLFFFSFAIFCGMFTGQLWGLPVFYAIFNGLASLTFLFFVLLSDEFLFGFSTSNLKDDLVQHLTPIWHFLDRLRLENIASTGHFTLIGWDTILCYALVGLLMGAGAYGIFSNRHLERAGEIVCVNFLRPLFTACLGVYGGFCALMLYCYVFNMANTGWLFFFLVLGTLLGVAIARMLLEKSVAIFTLANAKQFAAVLVLSCLCFMSIRFDLLGYEPFIPEAEDIDSIAILIPLNADTMTLDLYNDHSVYTAHTPHEIELVRKAHAAFLADYAETSKESPYDYAITGGYVTETAVTEPAIAEANPSNDGIPEFVYVNMYRSIDFEYTLTSGQKITRSYYLHSSAEELAREGSPLSYLEEFANGIDFVALLEDLRGQTDVSLNGSDGRYKNDVVGGALAEEAMDALIADVAVNGTTLSLLSKDYQHGEPNGRLYLGIYDVQKKNGKLDYDYLGSLTAECYPGSNMDAFLMQNLPEAE